MLDIIDTVVDSMAIMICFVAFSSALSLSMRGRIALAGGVGAWVGLATFAGAEGALRFAPEQPIPLLALFAVLPLAATAALWFSSVKFRNALLAIPTSLLIGLNSMRVLGVLFLGLAAVGRLSGPFPYSAGLGDIITGIAAAPLALALARGRHGLEPSIRAWNIFGALDLIAAIGFGLTSAAGGPLQIFHVGAGLRRDAAAPVLPRADRVGSILSDHARDRRGAAQVAATFRSRDCHPSCGGSVSRLNSSADAVTGAWRQSHVRATPPSWTRTRFMGTA